MQALRFIAAVLVVITHSTLYTHERLNPAVAVWGFGTIGVNIFFVISGFVMMVSTRSLQGKADAWKYFSMRRLVRIVPMYWVATTLKLVTMLILPGAVLHAALNPGNTILSYLFLPSRNVDGNVQPLLGVGWTLVFEMFFYAVFALGLFLRRNPLLFAGSILTLCAAASFFRGDGEWPAWAVYFDPIVLYFLIGMIIAKLAGNVHARRWIPLVLALVGACAFIMVTKSAEEGSFENFIFLMLITTGTVLAVVWLEPMMTGRFPKPVLFLGSASYSLYLFHPMIAPVVPEVLDRLALDNGILSVVLCVVAAVVATTIIYKFVEVPITKILQGLPYIRDTNRKRAAQPMP